MRIGLFDSGIGGLTVLKTLINKYPHNEYIYFGDTLNIPYGDKSYDELLTLARQNMEFLIRKNVDLIIIACGTISSNCVDVLRKEYQIPIYDIISPTIDYINNSDYQNILVIATQATINSHIFKNKINKHISELATPKLVPLIENNNLENIDMILHEYLDEYKNIDAIILGCTHYPVLKDNIKKIIKSDIIDMSNQINIKDGTKSNLEIYFSKLNDKIIANTKRVLAQDNLSIKKSIPNLDTSN